MKLIVDADACPKTVLQLCRQLGTQYGYEVWTVASFNHVISSEHHIVVGDNSQEADLKVINLTQRGDVVVTQDWGLAAMTIGRGARCVSPAGREYTNERMDFMLEEREVKAKLRRGGGRTKGPAKRTAADDRKFAAGLENILKDGYTI